MPQDDDLFPVKVYEYRPDGYHTGGVKMSKPELEIWLRANLRRILDQKLELRITDMWDRMAFHCADGLVLYDGEKHYGK